MKITRKIGVYNMYAKWKPHLTVYQQIHNLIFIIITILFLDYVNKYFYFSGHNVNWSAKSQNTQYWGTSFVRRSAATRPGNGSNSGRINLKKYAVCKIAHICESVASVTFYKQNYLPIMPHTCSIRFMSGPPSDQMILWNVPSTNCKRFWPDDMVNCHPAVKFLLCLATQSPRVSVLRLSPNRWT